MQTNSFIQHLLKNVSLDSGRVIECVESFSDGDTNDMMRIMAYLSGYSDLPEVPETSIVDDSATLISYNFFKDRVYYKFLSSSKLKVSEEYKNLDGQVYDCWYDVPKEVRQGSGDFEITVKWWSNNDCRLERWLKK